MGQTCAAVILKEEALSKIQVTPGLVPPRGPYTAATDGGGAENRPDFWNVLAVLGRHPCRVWEGPRGAVFHASGASFIHFIFPG